MKSESSTPQPWITFPNYILMTCGLPTTVSDMSLNLYRYTNKQTSSARVLPYSGIELSRIASTAASIFHNGGEVVNRAGPPCAGPPSGQQTQTLLVSKTISVTPACAKLLRSAAAAWPSAEERAD